ncbi:UrcA family protein [Novosphingobium album (ex Liu et al. 2023)]|uniref:UrcA family protein n=1 Tax=Novosphingobium album (ex Liu et al. 2023) TaxID=3031130 RepID=A0ABT5WP68_9SPHN|nr:UrcA family protein [Novosphingobium album (ex Liu et al. 2023)]MDE8650713.1 UrcA family protein [Novosphingobium album (ex Liu et al. 2023)]
MKKLIISGFAAACLVAAPAAFAEQVTVKINYTDLDLSRPDDVLALRNRVRNAVREACAPTSAVIGYYSSDASCAKDAIARAEAQIQSGRTLALAMAGDGKR